MKNIKALIFDGINPEKEPGLNNFRLGGNIRKQIFDRKKLVKNRKKIQSFLLVSGQFVFLIFIALYGGVFRSALSFLATLSAFSIGVWAMAALDFKVSPFPEVLDSQKEVRTGGPYRFVRHPMYSSILLASASWVWNRPDFFSISAWFFLLAVLLFKIRFEEGELLKKFPEYAHYRRKTKKLIPGIF